MIGQKWKQKAEYETIAVVQRRNHGDLDKGGGNGDEMEHGWN